MTFPFLTKTLENVCNLSKILPPGLNEKNSIECTWSALKVRQFTFYVIFMCCKLKMFQFHLKKYSDGILTHHPWTDYRILAVLLLQYRYKLV